MQKRRVYCWSLKSNTNLSPRHPQRSRHCERPQRCSKKREIRVPLRAPLFLGKWCEVTTYFLCKKKKKKKGKTKYKIHDQDTSLSLIEQRYIQSW